MAKSLTVQKKRHVSESFIVYPYTLFISPHHGYCPPRWDPASPPIGRIIPLGRLVSSHRHAHSSHSPPSTARRPEPACTATAAFLVGDAEGLAVEEPLPEDEVGVVALPPLPPAAADERRQGLVAAEAGRDGGVCALAGRLLGARDKVDDGALPLSRVSDQLSRL